MERLVLYRRVKVLAQNRGSHTPGRRNRPPFGFATSIARALRGR